MKDDLQTPSDRLAVLLPPHLRDFVRDEVAAGRYASADALVADALERLEAATVTDEEQLERLRAKLQTAADQIERGEGRALDREGLRAMRKELKALAAQHAPADSQ